MNGQLLKEDRIQAEALCVDYIRKQGLGRVMKLCDKLRNPAPSQHGKIACYNAIDAKRASKWLKNIKS